MATGFTLKARARLAEAEAAIRGHLTHGNSRAAVNAAIRTLQSELSKNRDRRPGHAPLIDAALAAQLLAIAAQVHQHKPIRPVGCSPIPQPADMTRAFDQGLEFAALTGESR